jgi:sugar phosphate isomerase/epimerase
MEDREMARPITLCAGQWADLPLETLCAKAKEIGFDGLELCCGGNQFDVSKAMADPNYGKGQRQTLAKYGLKMFSLSNHLVGQAILDPLDARHKAILPAYVWGDGNPDGVHARAAEDMKNCARAASQLGLGVVNGFTGSSIWHLLYSFPPVSPATIDDGFKLLAKRFHPILDVFAECNVKFGLEVHPTEIAFDLYTAERAVEALDRRPEFGFNFDPSHLIWQGVDPAKFIRKFPDRIYHVHMKDAIVTLDGSSGILSSHLNFGDARRGWDFRSLGRGGVDFESIIRALNDIGYTGPLSVEWEDSGMKRERGARESLEFVKKLDFEPSRVAFDSAFEKKT